MFGGPISEQNYGCVRTPSAGLRPTRLIDPIDVLVENVVTACVYVFGCRVGND